MASRFLDSLSEAKREEFLCKLWRIQNGRCFITDDPIDLQVHLHDLDIDHIVPLSLGGKDDEGNLALTFASANRSKQASDLKLARIIYAFDRLKKLTEETESRSPNLGDVLKRYDGAKALLDFHREGENISYSFSAVGCNSVISTKVLTDKLSGSEYFFALVPIEYLYHDAVINPRSIGKNVSQLIAEFYKQNPQLHVSLGWIDITTSTSSKICIFDGQHKAAAQLLLGVREIPVRIFVNPDKDRLIQTNFTAGTKLRQVAFDKSVQRHLGNTIYRDRVSRYQRENGLDEENLDFSEKDLVDYFKGESMKRYILDAIRNGILQDAENKLSVYIDRGGKAKEKPLSYSTVEKTFFSFFINPNIHTSKISHGLEEGTNPRALAKTQLLELMNIIAEEILIDQFDFDLGTSLIESKLQRGADVPIEHLRACRMCREEILYCWLGNVGQVIYNYFSNTGISIGPKEFNRLFEIEFSPVLWGNIRNYMHNLRGLPLWVDINLSATVFGGKQNYDYWRTIFLKGKTPQFIPVLSAPLNLNEMVKP